MARGERKHFDIDIVDLSEAWVDDCARLHAASFPEKLETLLGHDCIADCLRRRYINPPGDCFCRVAILKSERRLVSYCYAQTLHADGGWSNAFLSAAIAKEHMVRKVCVRPRLWGWVAGRAYSSLFGRDANEGASLVVQPGWEVAKMLAVHPDVRGSNVGTDMMLDNEAEARRRGARRICGLVERGNIKAERLYASIGWVRSSDSGDKYRVFAMHKDL